MRNNVLVFCLLVIAQALICNYLHISLYLTVSILPVIILCLPLKIDTLRALLIAFVAGFAVDFTAEGVLGLNVMSLLPVALIRRKLCVAIFGEDLESRGDDFSVQKYGPVKVAFAVLVSVAIFLFFYIWADGGSDRPFTYNLIRFLVSLCGCMIISFPIADMLTKERRR